MGWMDGGGKEVPSFVVNPGIRSGVLQKIEQVGKVADQLFGLGFQYLTND